MAEIARRDSPTKEFVNVICACWAETGKTEPLKLQRTSGESMWIDRVLDVRRAASLRAGGQGIRYICQIVFEDDDGRCFKRQIALYHDGNYWFIELDDDGKMVDFVA